MSPDDWNKWLTLGANLGVFVGLVLLAFEVNQAQTQLRIQALADASDNYTESMQTLALDEGLSTLIFRAETEFEELNAFEHWRVSKYLDGFMILSEQDYLVITELESGAYGFQRDWQQNMGKLYFRDYWRTNEDRFGYEFRAFINEILGVGTTSG